MSCTVDKIQFVSNFGNLCLIFMVTGIENMCFFDFYARFQFSGKVCLDNADHVMVCNVDLILKVTGVEKRYFLDLCAKFL